MLKLSDQQSSLLLLLERKEHLVLDLLAVGGEAEGRDSLGEIYRVC